MTTISILRIIFFLGGVGIVIETLLSAIKTFVLPRSAPDQITRLVFVLLRYIFNFRMKWANTYKERDRVMALYAPIGLLCLVPTWYTLVAFGYMAMYWALGIGSWQDAFRLSGSSLLTLGFSSPKNIPMTILVITEATIGLILVALLIAYLPTMYADFSRRETTVNLLEIRAGNPPSAVEMLSRFYRIHGLDHLNEVWREWEVWFADVEKSHTALPALVFFRSPRPDHSWVTAAGAVLDTASITLSSVDIPNDPLAALCIRAGFLALRRIADFFSIPYAPDPHYPHDTISITQEEFMAALDSLSAAEVPLKADRQQAWLDFAGWRVNYDQVLLALAILTIAPESPWTGNRSSSYIPPPLITGHE
jgi:hypothetical protein